MASMRFLAVFLFLTMPMAAFAACEGRDQRGDLPNEVRAEMERAAAAIPYPEGNHWVATRGNTVLHLIGTLHVNDPRMGLAADRLEPLIERASSVWFELNPADLAAFEREVMSNPKVALITEGPTLIELMSEEGWKRIAQALAERNVPAWMGAKMQPWVLGAVLSLPPCLLRDPEAKQGMDKRLSVLADMHDVPQHSLETGAELLALFTATPIEEQARELEMFADNLGADADQLATLSAMYFEERHAEFMEFSRRDAIARSGLSPEVFDPLWDSFMVTLVEGRNRNWMRHILDIRDQTAVIAVGAGHLHGESGLLNLLALEGYLLERAAF
ncbi:TraB/GumN family protein [Ruegeria aquimaris]|uniref:TraB/GumN family protein n=1 Tax=Ruegeria aquimaris TaxID=2984333 RepID=A0ABT3AJ44_9RHOB|nr:TraB/GumN family protein [Ruegeria sp. XHP0148]MCV2888681.1 TraB/GumN family protein [Ruegeria sp. XHP0148]